MSKWTGWKQAQGISGVRGQILDDDGDVINIQVDPLDTSIDTEKCLSLLKKHQLTGVYEVVSDE